MEKSLIVLAFKGKEVLHFESYPYPEQEQEAKAAFDDYFGKDGVYCTIYSKESFVKEFVVPVISEDK